MKLKRLLEISLDKNNFNKVNDYLDFCEKYLTFIKNNLQAVIISKNENNYQFFQYKKDGTFNVTRPINSEIMINLENFNNAKSFFLDTLKELRKVQNPIFDLDGTIINNIVYTAQQTIGATLDALPAKKSKFCS